MERFWEKVDKSNECWLWKASCDSYGYGHISVEKMMVKSHRLSWELTHGPIPCGLYVLHKCDNPKCVNPEHLFLGTALDNARDRDKKGRGACGKRNGRFTSPETTPRGESHHKAKLSESDIVEIRKLLVDGVSHRKLGVMFGVTHATIGAIHRRKTWAHL